MVRSRTVRRPRVGDIALLACACWLILSIQSSLYAQEPESRDPVLVIHYGYDGDGASTRPWLAAIEHRHTSRTLDSVAQLKRPRSAEAKAWESLILSRLPVWSRSLDSLRIPFPTTDPPDTVTVLLGHLGGQDAFVFAPSTICFDLERLFLEYGNSTTPENADRIDRFFAHEFTHILHKAWARERGLQLRTPLDLALWECLTEGLGNYRSLTTKRVNRDGSLTEHARGVMKTLEPIFAERMHALDRATEAEAGPLLQGLSDGRFDRKWGALPVALWLAQETHRNDRNLGTWVDAGPGGVLVLARRYLPEELRRQLPKTGCQ